MSKKISKSQKTQKIGGKREKTLSSQEFMETFFGPFLGGMYQHFFSAFQNGATLIPCLKK